MAILLRGKKKGDKVQLHQYSNGWVTDLDNHVYNITSLLFSDEEIAQMKLSKYTGYMFDAFEIKQNRFYKRKNEHD